MSPQNAWLISSQGHRIAVPAGGSLRVGREPDNSLALDDNTVSRYHAVIEPAGQGFRVRDLGSSNGTFVNGGRVGEVGVAMANGDSVRFGTVNFHFAQDHASEQETRGYSPRSVFCTRCGGSMLPDAVECPNCGAARLVSRSPDQVIRAGGWPSREVKTADEYYPSDGKLIAALLFALPLFIAYLVARRNRQSRNVQRVSVGAGWALTGLAYLSMLVSFWPSAVGGDMYHYNKGVHYLEQKQTDLAEQQFKLALQDDPDLAEAHINLANVYDQTGWYEGAEQEAKKGVDILERTHETGVEGNTWQQTLSVAYTMLGAAKAHHADKMGDSDPLNALVELKEAVNDFKKAVELDPTNAQAQVDLDRFKNNPLFGSSP